MGTVKSVSETFPPRWGYRVGNEEPLASLPMR
jgi:hypothetical protein